MSISTKAVVYCYRYILGREPESEQNVAGAANEYDSFADLQLKFFQSEEFATKIGDGRHIKKWIILPADATIRESNFDIMDCIGMFESGAQNIYLIDENKKYTGKAIGKRSCHLKKDKSGAWQYETVDGDALVFGGNPIENADALQPLADSYFQQHPLSSECIVLGDDGVPTCIVRRYVPNKPFDWQYFDKFIDIHEYLPGGKIFVASLRNEGVRNFYDFYKDRLDMDVLDEKSIMKIYSENSGGVDSLRG